MSDKKRKHGENMYTIPIVQYEVVYLFIIY